MLITSSVSAGDRRENHLRPHHPFRIVLLSYRGDGLEEGCKKKVLTPGKSIGSPTAGEVIGLLLRLLTAASQN
ncbi:MAG TPA: hypothetical protein PKW42_00990 [bacterium]|nr:hypothetical protein [bacterium]